MRSVAIATAFDALVVASPALAANSGPYFGVGVTHDNVAAGGDLEGMGINGLGGTAFAGYDIAVSEKAFIGIEANFDLASAKVGDADQRLEIDHAFGATARLGYNVNDKTALYGRVGYQRGRGTEVVEGQRFSTSLDGLRLGAGLETAVTDRVSLRAEYNHTHYSFSDEVEADLAPAKAGVNNNQFSIAVSYGF